jgi:UDP-3-O-[3-hydroxymyristoyl] N-acetylglucosamine deacetylase / 3-hydroxyacyl-[acyl-carrier-protein] dehydratase
MTTTEKQRTIARPATIEGLGLFMGEKAAVRFSPAPVNHGVVFVRMDITEAGAPVRIPALVSNVTKRARRTTLRRGPAAVETCEHVLSALMGLGIDNILVDRSSLGLTVRPSRTWNCSLMQGSSSRTRPDAS